MDPLKHNIEIQRASLRNMLIDPMQRISHEISAKWDDKKRLDRALLSAVSTLPYVKYIYAMNPDGIQMSDNAARDEGLIGKDFGRDRSARPYMSPYPSVQEMTLSDTYISQRIKRPSITAIQPVHREGELLGFLGADVDLRDLPLTLDVYKEPNKWQQLKGDPAIRGQLFKQQRVESRLDRHIDEILPVIEELMCESGVYHGKIHFSSNRATIWHIDDPYCYRLLDYDALIDPNICFIYPHREYPHKAMIPKDAIALILDTFKYLRFADDTIYLRAGSINIFNGIVGLNFSCDGSHYIPYTQFLAKDSRFWGDTS